MGKFAKNQDIRMKVKMKVKLKVTGAQPRSLLGQDRFLGIGALR